MKTPWTRTPLRDRRAVCRAALAALCLLALSAGCAAPMGARRTTAEAVYAQLSQSALTGDVASADTRNVLARHGLLEDFKDNPDEALASLHRVACADSRPDTLFALAELHYLHGTQRARSLLRGRRRAAADAYLSAAVYAYLFLAADDAAAGIEGLDRRTRMACEIYNRALAEAFVDATSSAGHLRFVTSRRELPPGSIPITVRAQDPDLAPGNVETYLAADRLLVHGMSVRNRASGLGAPLVFSARGAVEKRRVRWQPATAVLRVIGSVSDWSQGTMAATLELHVPGSTIDLAGRPVPMEADTTAPIAQALSNKQIWGIGRLQFLTGREVYASGIYTMEPYRPGRIPVLFVHGTMSSPVRWAEMWNTLSADPLLRERYQFWNFIYTSGSPLAVSANTLREAIRATLAELDPEGNDPALQQMVVIGHSQGGLLTRMAVTDTGDTLWRIASDQDFETLPMSSGEREKLRKAFFYTPLPSIRRVIFIATPHRGSYRASFLARSLAQRFITLPSNVLRTSLVVAKLPLRYLPGRAGSPSLPTSIVGMAPNNPYLHAIADMPFPQGVQAHSIIAIGGDAEPPEGDDGVVSYRSAHLEQVTSELVVRSDHSCQGKPATIEEVRRILTEHLAASAPQEPLPQQR